MCTDESNTGICVRYQGNRGQLLGGATMHGSSYTVVSTMYLLQAATSILLPNCLSDRLEDRSTIVDDAPVYILTQSIMALQQAASNMWKLLFGFGPFPAACNENGFHTYRTSLCTPVFS